MRPRAFLLETVRKALQKETRKLLISRGGDSLDTPTMLEELNAYIKVLHLLGHYSNVPMGAMVRECLAAEMTSSVAKEGRCSPRFEVFELKMHLDRIMDGLEQRSPGVWARFDKK